MLLDGPTVVRAGLAELTVGARLEWEPSAARLEEELCPTVPVVAQGRPLACWRSWYVHTVLQKKSELLKLRIRDVSSKCTTLRPAVSATDRKSVV